MKTDDRTITFAYVYHAETRKPLYRAYFEGSQSLGGKPMTRAQCRTLASEMKCKPRFIERVKPDIGYGEQLSITITGPMTTKHFADTMFGLQDKVMNDQCVPPVVARADDSIILRIKKTRRLS